MGYICEIGVVNGFSFFTSPRIQQHSKSNRHGIVSLKSGTTSSQQQFEYGDTKGAVLSCQDVKLFRNGETLLRVNDWKLNRKERWALLGPNGCGKSTLLSAIVGTLQESYEGDILVSNPSVNIGYLQQTAVDGSTRTVYEEACSGMKDIELAKERLEQAEQKLQSSSAENSDQNSRLLSELEKAQENFEQVGGYTQRGTVEKVLKGLGFDMPNDGERFCSEFSGGWQMRIALAKLLLSEPDVLLLDEPSNHLDVSARHWLASDYLSNYPHTVVLVTHDVKLLQASQIQHIAEISNNYFHTYISKNYNQYLEEKEFRAKSAQAEYEQNMETAAKLQAYIDRFGASATKASSAQSRLKQLQRMKDEGKLDPPTTTAVATVQNFKPSLVLPPPPKSMGHVLLGLSNANVGYSEDNCLLSNVNIEVTRGMKLWLRGPNGAGKSTVLSSLRGTLPLLGGERLTNEQLHLGIFTQDLAQELDVTKRAIDLVTAHAREGSTGDITISDEMARSVMGRLGLSGDKATSIVGNLSGGEKARVALSMFALKPSNVLLLDEPSNHLDIECIDALSESIQKWGTATGNNKKQEGAVVIISHDRSFCESIDFTHVGTVENGKVTVQERSMNSSGEDWKIQSLSHTTGTTAGTSSTTNDMEGGNAKGEEIDKNLRKQLYNAPKRIKKIEKAIETCEEKIEQYDEEMMTVGNDVGKLMDITKLKDEQQAKVDEMMIEWEELEELLLQHAS